MSSCWNWVSETLVSCIELILGQELDSEWLPMSHGSCPRYLVENYPEITFCTKSDYLLRWLCSNTCGGLCLPNFCTCLVKQMVVQNIHLLPCHTIDQWYLDLSWQYPCMHQRNSWKIFSKFDREQSKKADKCAVINLKLTQTYQTVGAVLLWTWCLGIDESKNSEIKNFHISFYRIFL